MKKDALALYLHWPFCLSKCPYCDFNSAVADSVDTDAWTKAYLREIDGYASLMPKRTISSIYFGGGTPSLMPPEMVGALLDKIAALWPLSPSVEITLEANPTSVEIAKFQAFRTAGVNRLSLGIQALRDEALAFLGRQHTAAEAKAAFALAQRCFPRTTFDMIYARAGQTLEAWREELDEALDLGAAHMSLYQLTIEHGSAFFKHAQPESLIAAEETAACMFEETLATMAKRGVPLYEISNFARTGEESLHNLTYWHYEDYVGIGPGAHGRLFFDERRHASENHRSAEAWLRQVDKIGHGRLALSPLTLLAAQQEALLMGLRLAEGIKRKNWQRKFGLPLDSFLAPEKLDSLRRNNLIEITPTHLRVPPLALQKLNAILDYLL